MIKNIIDKNEQTAPNAGEMEVLHRYFSQCFTKEGTFDIDLFKSQIQDKVNITHEGYDLNFLGKNYAKLLSSMDTTTVIVPDEEHNALPENANSQNIYISGDNLDGLKHLLKSYAGAVKCIYIDPPYNTGTDGFVYNDRFTFTAEELSAKLSISEEQAAKILDLTRRGSASHSAWLTFMACRLQLACDLLTDDGVIFISIDDNEQANLKLLCDSIFGEENFEANIIPIVNPGGRDYKQIAITNEYLLCYSKSEENILNEMPKETTFDFEDSSGGYNIRELRNRNPKFHSGNRPNLFYPFYVNPNIKKDGFCAVSTEKSEEYHIEVKPYNSVGAESVWRWGVPRSQNNIVLGDIDKSQVIARQRRDGNWNIYEKNRRTTTKVKSVWDETEMRTEEGTREIRSLFGETYFNHPKPVALIKRCILIGSNQDDIVLDFFSGSATTAQSVFEVNAENIDEQRRWIMVQLPEATPPNSEARNAGYNTIDQIGQERIRRAAAKIKAETGADIDYGFKHYTLAEPDSNTLDQLENFDPNAMFADETVLEKFGKSTVLETWLVRDGYGFGASANEVKLDGYTAYHNDKHLYLIDIEFTEKDLAVLIDRYNSDAAFCPENIVIFGYSFTFTQTEMLRKNTVVLRDGDKNLKINIDVRY